MPAGALAAGWTLRVLQEPDREAWKREATLKMLLFKVLGENGTAIHGGSGSWPLPTKGKPGKWLTLDCEPKCCECGLHLVADALEWWKPKARLYVAEPDLSRPISTYGDKGAFQRARLLYEVTRDWPVLGMFPRVRCFMAASARSRDKDADISGADLSGANLSGAYLYGADLYGAYRPTDAPEGWEPDESGCLRKK